MRSWSGGLLDTTVCSVMKPQSTLRATSRLGGERDICSVSVGHDTANNLTNMSECTYAARLLFLLSFSAYFYSQHCSTPRATQPFRH